MKDIKLLPCPRCESGEVYLLQTQDFTAWGVACAMCGHESKRTRRKREAVDDWNGRYSLPPLPASERHMVASAKSFVGWCAAGGKGSDFITVYRTPEIARAVIGKPVDLYGVRVERGKRVNIAGLRWDLYKNMKPIEEGDITIILPEGPEE